MLNGEDRQVALQTLDNLHSQMKQKRKLNPAKDIAARFLGGELALADLANEFDALAVAAASSLTARTAHS
jgi:hypothetical protein